MKLFGLLIASAFGGMIGGRGGMPPRYLFVEDYDKVCQIFWQYLSSEWAVYIDVICCLYSESNQVVYGTPLEYSEFSMCRSQQLDTIELCKFWIEGFYDAASIS